MCRIRITLSSKSVRSLEKVCTDLKQAALDKELRVSGPVRLPTKTLGLTTRQVTLRWREPTPGTGSRCASTSASSILRSPSEIVKQITSIGIEPGVEVEVFFKE